MFNPGALEAPFDVLPAVPRDRRPAFALDETSRLAEVDAHLSLGAVEALLSRTGLSLGLGCGVDWSSSIADWIALGLPAAQDAWADPVATRITGFEATAGGIQARVRSAPRRATGPDLLALFAGTQRAIGQLERVTLAVAPVRAASARTQAFQWDRDPPVSGSEARAFELVRRSLSVP